MDENTTVSTETNETTATENQVEQTDVEKTSVETEGSKNYEAELAKLKMELLKANQKADQMAKEAADHRKKWKSLQTAEEQKAEEERERQEAIENELKALRKQASVASVSKRVMSFVNDEAMANTIAEKLYGAEFIDDALDEIQKAWTIKEKKLRQEFGKIPAPVAGEDAPTISKEDILKMGYKERADYAHKYPETYSKIFKTN